MPKQRNTVSGKVRAAITDYKCEAPFTPDMPILRFAGPQRVFLWDDLRLPKGLSKLGLREGEHFKTEYFLSYTAGSFIPCYNNATSGFLANFKHFLPVTPNGKWTDVMDLPPDHLLKLDEPAPITGRVLLFSLEGLRMLDDYYENTCVFRRAKLWINTHSIHMARDAKKETQKFEAVSFKAWVYVNHLTSITRYNAHEQKHSFLSGISPARLPKCFHDKKSMWVSMNHNKVG